MFGAWGGGTWKCDSNIELEIDNSLDEPGQGPPIKINWNQMKEKFELICFKVSNRPRFTDTNGEFLVEVETIDMENFYMEQKWKRSLKSAKIPIHVLPFCRQINKKNIL